MDGAADTTSIEEKFGISGVSGLTGAAAVDAAFHELSAFIKKGGLSDQPGVINLGDWIDLESLTVEAYGDGNGGFAADNDPIVPDPPLIEGYDGKLLRLIVVGINSFQPNESYDVPENAGVGHVVFQFQNLPVTRRMNETNTNGGGYRLSEMREYLVGVDGKGGNFLAGLKTAGVPEDVLWPLVRYVANGYNDVPRGTDALTDLLWLPTEREMFGSQTYSFAGETGETEENQARLEYYTRNDYEYRLKFLGNNPIGSAYWMSSPLSSSQSPFCSVTSVNPGSQSSAGYHSANVPYGVAPAFCVR